MKRFSLALAFIAITILGIAVLTDFLPLVILLAVLALSVITYLIYWWDKSAARKGSWRTPESTLHLLSLVGGWPGALIAQQTLRHKTQKQPFRFVFWLTVLVNCVLIAWLSFEGYFEVFYSFL